ncbi:MAG: hypothetical protein D6677_11990 [Calditrichaeota bacterium]|nr:MAG: hypothetical protein D6677_11990 [Calditrichota bacterium]
MTVKNETDNLPTVEDYQKLIEELRVHLNVLNASVFLLEEEMAPDSTQIHNYMSKINNELEVIRKMIAATPKVTFQKN